MPDASCCAATPARHLNNAFLITQPACAQYYAVASSWGYRSIRLLNSLCQANCYWGLLDLGYSMSYISEVNLLCDRRPHHFWMESSETVSLFSYSRFVPVHNWPRNILLESVVLSAPGLPTVCSARPPRHVQKKICTEKKTQPEAPRMRTQVACPTHSDNPKWSGFHSKVRNENPFQLTRRGCAPHLVKKRAPSTDVFLLNAPLESPTIHLAGKASMQSNQWQI